MKTLSFLFLSIIAFGTYNQDSSLQFDSPIVDTIRFKCNEKNCLSTSKNFVEDSNTLSIDSAAKSTGKEQTNNTPVSTSNDSWRYILPIVTLLLGIFINRGIDFLTERKKIRKTGERWIAEVRCLETPMLNQVKELKSFLNLMPLLSFEIPRITVFSVLNCEIFKSLDKSELLKFIETSSKKGYLECVQISNRTNGFISVTASIQDSLKEKFGAFLKESSTHITLFSKNLNNLCLAFADFGAEIEKEIKSDPSKDSRFSEMSKLFQDHIFSKSKEGNYDVPQLEDSFFRPLITELSKLRLDDRTKELRQITARCRTDIRGIIMEREYMTENTKKIIELYENQVKDLPEVIRELERKRK